MSKVDTYFDDLTSCLLFGFLEHKRLTEKEKHIVFLSYTIVLSHPLLTSVLLRELSVRPLYQWRNCLSAGVDFTLPPNLYVVELRPPCREQTNLDPVEQYWMDLVKYKLENEIYLEESQHVLDIIKDIQE
ncbi:13617_t:CDS:2 [Funneliformis caledonium]|uniref:13617_t:CDS:1 n=1 Tax=Funneliformis caledonium TaxID=1117310 RepID=A0A9N9DC65_9GLOM|nr:13617_t:CDS:2 [Funneliformis caledonium]